MLWFGTLRLEPEALASIRSTTTVHLAVSLSGRLPITNVSVSSTVAISARRSDKDTARWTVVVERMEAKVRGIKEPIASIRIDSNEKWSIFVTDNGGGNGRVDGGQGADDMSILLSDLRDRQTF